jgi:hypothetical protein
MKSKLRLVLVVIVGGALLSAAGAFGATTASLALKAGQAESITCSNSLSNTSVQATSETVTCAAKATTTPTPGTQTAQAITFTSTPPSNAAVGGTYTVTAQGGGSGQPVVFSVDGTTTLMACGVKGDTVSLVTAGTCVIDANQAGTSSYQAAPQVQQSFTIKAAPSSSATTPPPTSWACVTSAQQGACPSSGAYTSYPQIAMPDGIAGPYVDQNVWNPISGWQQTLSANSPGDWQVVANMPAGNTAVVAFPNTGFDPTGTVDSYSQITSAFDETMNATSQTSAWAMYDLWFNNWGNEVMIQYDFANNGACTPVATATFGGSNGVPVQQWHLCQFGSTLDWKLGANDTTGKQSEHSGSIDILAMIKWLETNGYLPAGSTWTALSDGWEICSTGGQNETFSLSNFSVTATT